MKFKFENVWDYMVIGGKDVICESILIRFKYLCISQEIWRENVLMVLTPHYSI